MRHERSSFPGGQSDTVAGNHRFINGKPEARPIRQPHEATGGIDLIAERGGLKLAIKSLDRHLAGQRRADMNRRDEARPEIGRMRRDLGAVRLRQRDDLLHRRDAADLGDARLHVVHLGAPDQRFEIRHRAAALAGRDRDAAFGAHPRHAVVVLGRPYRLLEPEEVVRRHALGHRNGFVGCPGTIGVDHQLDLGADDAARRRHFGLGDLVQLDARITLLKGVRGVALDEVGLAVAQQARIDRHALGGLAAQHAIERLAGDLAGDIPQRDVEAGQRIGDRPVARRIVELALQVAHQAADVARIAAERERRHQIGERSPRRRAGAEPESLAPADDARRRSSP